MVYAGILSLKNAPGYSKHPIATLHQKKSNIPFQCQPGNVHLNQNQKKRLRPRLSPGWRLDMKLLPLVAPLMASHISLPSHQPKRIELWQRVRMATACHRGLRIVLWHQFLEDAPVRWPALSWPF